MHNDYRKKVMNCELKNQPPAKNLPDLEWDNDLALYAQLLANECAFRSINGFVSKYQHVGQNQAMFPTIKEAVNSWFEEYTDYDFDTQNCTSVCGNYIQMVWQNTTKVGCGVKDCSQQLGYPIKSVNCYYSEAAIWPGQRPYETKSQSECPNKPASVGTAPGTTVTATTST
ncbi:unnamed protein product [Trichobilharzia szidati]|nr:unnamed protein product [Trichobilharzia szidati]